MTIKKQFLLNTLLPVIVLGVVLIVTGFFSFRYALLGETRQELENIGDAVILYYDKTYPGDFILAESEVSGKVKYDLEKGGTVITYDYSYIDDIKARTGIDISIIYTDTIILTTIGSEDNSRPIGIGLNSTILDDVLDRGKSMFYDDTVIDDREFYAYFTPVKDENNTVIGMLFVGKTKEELDNNLYKALIPLLAAGAILVVIISAITASAGRRMVSAIEKVDKYFAAVTAGNLNALMHPEVAGRNDELGDMARNAQTMQKSLKTLIECDALTELFNRRYAEKRLNTLYSKSAELGTPFCVSIVDIDFFKKVNDTYGHEAGDVVLKGVSRILERNMVAKGYVARWGGEEFLCVFEKMGLADATRGLEAILDQIRESSFHYQDQVIRVTITSGVSEMREGISLNDLLKEADDKLYNGKQAGRNRIVSTL